MPEQAIPARPATVIAFDFGRRRIGVAVGQTITGSASPLGVATNGDRGPDFEHITKLLQEWRPNQLVVGLPMQADGSIGDIGNAARQFAVQLERYGLPVVLIDERHTSQQAQQLLQGARRSGSHGRIRKATIDAAAAVLIAERYLQNPKSAHGSG